MPIRPIVSRSASWAGAVRSRFWTSPVGRSARGSTLVGSTPVTRRSTGTANLGALAASAKVLMSSTVGCGSGFTRWKAWPSRPGWCAMWSIALAT